MEEVQQDQQPKHRTFHWEPKCFTRKKEGQPDEKLYEGHLIVRAMTGEERSEMLANCGALDAKEELAGKSKGTQGKWLLDIYKQNKGLILGAEVVRVADQAKLNLEDVAYEEPLFQLPMEFAACMLNGFHMGNG